MLDDKSQNTGKARDALNQAIKNRAERDQEYHNNFRNTQKKGVFSDQQIEEYARIYKFTSFAYDLWFESLDPEGRKKLSEFKVFSPIDHSFTSADELSKYIRSGAIDRDITTLEHNAKEHAEQKGKFIQERQNVEGVLNYLQAYTLKVDDIQTLLSAVEVDTQIISSLKGKDELQEYQELITQAKTKLHDLAGKRIMDLSPTERQVVLNTLNATFKPLTLITNKMEGSENQLYFKEHLTAPLTAMKSITEMVGMVKQLDEPALLSMEQGFIEKAGDLTEPLKKAFADLRDVRANDNLSTHSEIAPTIKLFEERKIILKQNDIKAATQSEFEGLAATRLQSIKNEKSKIIAHLPTIQFRKNKLENPKLHTMAWEILQTCQRKPLEVNEKTVKACNSLYQSLERASQNPDNTFIADYLDPVPDKPTVKGKDIIATFGSKSDDIANNIAKMQYLRNWIEDPDLFLSQLNKMAPDLFNDGVPNKRKTLLNTKFAEKFNAAFEEAKLEAGKTRPDLTPPSSPSASPSLSRRSIDLSDIDIDFLAPPSLRSSSDSVTPTISRSSSIASFTAPSSVSSGMPVVPTPSSVSGGIPVVPTTPSSVSSGIPVVPTPSSVASGIPVVPTPSSVASGIPVVPTPSSVASGIPVVPTPSSVSSGIPVVPTPSSVPGRMPETPNYPYPSSYPYAPMPSYGASMPSMPPQGEPTKPWHSWDVRDDETKANRGSSICQSIMLACLAILIIGLFAHVIFLAPLIGLIASAGFMQKFDNNMRQEKASIATERNREMTNGNMAPSVYQTPALQPQLMYSPAPMIPPPALMPMNYYNPSSKPQNYYQGRLQEQRSQTTSLGMDKQTSA